MFPLHPDGRPSFDPGPLAGLRLPPSIRWRSGAISDEPQLFVVNLFCGVVNLLCGVVNLFCGVVNLVCGVVNLVCGVVNLVCGVVNLVCGGL